MGWNYRVMKHEEMGEVWYGIHEVYYGEDGKAHLYAIDPDVSSESEEGLLDMLEKMKDAVNGANGPVLTPDDFG